MEFTFRKKQLRRQRTTTPYVNQGKGATLVPGTVKLLHQKKKKKINGDQEGCRLDLLTAPDES